MREKVLVEFPNAERRWRKLRKFIPDSPVILFNYEYYRIETIEDNLVKISETDRERFLENNPSVIPFDLGVDKQ